MKASKEQVSDWVKGGQSTVRVGFIDMQGRAELVLELMVTDSFLFVFNGEKNMSLELASWTHF